MGAAVLLDALAGEGMKVPRPGKDVLVYARKKDSGEYVEGDYYKWERPYLKGAVNSEYVGKHCGEVLLNLDFTHLAELVDVQPGDGGKFIHSKSEPYSEEDLEAEVLQNWIKHFKLDFHQVHASGHCSGREVEEIVKEIKPKVLFPVHTEHPEMFRKFAGLTKRVVVSEGEKRYQI